MPNETPPPVPIALKAAQNGSIGEARVRSFLLNNFWVLERSVDIHGADFLIQERLTDRNRLTRQRLGIVQAKYVQDGATGIKIPESYVVDDDDHPRREFFVLVCTGDADDERMYLLTAEDVIVDLTRSGGFFSAKAKAVIESHNRLVVSKTEALRRIEHSLRSTSVEDNYSYLAARGYVEPDLAHIDADLAEPISNWYGDLPRVFRSAKNDVRQLLTVVESLQLAFDEMLRTTDPEKFSETYAGEIAEYVRWDGDLVIGKVGRIDDGDFLRVVKLTREFRRQLTDRGLLSSFPALLGGVARAVTSLLAATSPLQGAVHVQAHFDPHSLLKQSITVRLDRVLCAGDPISESAIVLMSGATPHSLDTVVVGESPGLIEICRRLPSHTRMQHDSDAVRAEIADLMKDDVQRLLHRQLFGDDEGLL